MPATDAQIARINELSGLARTAWFSLLGYLVFVGIPLLRVRETTLLGWSLGMHDHHNSYYAFLLLIARGEKDGG